MSDVKTQQTAQATTNAAVDWNDIQALLRFGFGHLPEASFLLLQIREVSAARAWLAAAPVTSAIDSKPLPNTALQVALTHEGLQALKVPAEFVAQFSNEFLNGMSSDAGRSRRLGDVAGSDPSRWRWGTAQNTPHVLVLLYAAEGQLASLQQQILTQCSAGFTLLAALPTGHLSRKEPFGFDDGISQPKLDWQRERLVRDADQDAYTNLSCLGEYLLGYPNEYGAYSDRPLLATYFPGAAQLPRAEDAPERADLGRNGSYLVLRQLQQDVQGFWQYLDRQANGDATVREQLAAAMVGRTRDGEPLVERGGAVIEGNGDKPSDAVNAFTYQGDPQGLRCPLGAHIRRSNPRNADLPAGKADFFSRLLRILGFKADLLDSDLVASTRFHRLLRRGRSYGAILTPEQAIASQVSAANATSTGSGLHFICLGASIGRQFEFVQAAWMAGTKFAGLSGESDPLLGQRQLAPDGSATDQFSIPHASGCTRHLTAMPAFVTVRGGAYFFLPGIRALRFLARAF
jgi:deferrochelatase/peroxidase EfeB